MISSIFPSGESFLKLDQFTGLKAHSNRSAFDQSHTTTAIPDTNYQESAFSNYYREKETSLTIGRAIQMTHVALDALSKATELNQKQINLSLSASTSSLSDEDRMVLNDTFQQQNQQLVTDIRDAKFGGRPLMDGHLDAHPLTIFEDNARDKTLILAIRSIQLPDVSYLSVSSQKEAQAAYGAHTNFLELVQQEIKQLNTSSLMLQNALASNLSNLSTAYIRDNPLKDNSATPVRDRPDAQAAFGQKLSELMEWF